jgi:hypothetical protein
MAREVRRFIRYALVPWTPSAAEVAGVLDRWLVSVNYVELADILFKLRSAAKENRALIVSSIEAARDRARARPDSGARLRFLETHV